MFDVKSESHRGAARPVVLKQNSSVVIFFVMASAMPRLSTVHIKSHFLTHLAMLHRSCLLLCQSQEMGPSAPLQSL